VACFIDLHEISPVNRRAIAIEATGGNSHMTSSRLHESAEDPTPEIREMHRAACLFAASEDMALFEGYAGQSAELSGSEAVVPLLRAAA
jgi:hypothetical protein